MDETATRRKKIDPALYAVGWEQVPESEILTEQRAYEIAPGQISSVKHSHPKKADYILEYKGKKLAVIEAKSDELDVAVGVDQAKLYAEMLQIRFTYSTNGDEIWAIDMGVKDAKGNYIIPSTEGPVDKFPSPQELWKMTYPDENIWRDKFNLCALNRGGGRTPRYYQEIAINNVLSAVARKQNRILLTMATGTGKTYTAFQICWKLFTTRWNIRGTTQQPRILFISDRNILANQAINDFEQFNEDAMTRITPESIHKAGEKVPKGRSLYFTIFQTFMGCPEGSDTPYFMQYPQDFFDFIIIDECHRGGANDESEWRRLMDYFAPAYQLGMTATPLRKVNANTYKYFGEPVYSYSLKQGIADGFLVPFRVKIGRGNADTYTYDEDDTVKGDIDKTRTYGEKDFANGVIKMKDRDEHRVVELLQQIDPDEKTIVFCSVQEHAMIVRDLINKHKRRPDSNYCMRVTADDGEEGEKILRQFQNNEKLRPTILTTSRKLSTGVDARNVRNIVLMRPVNNMVEFKQIIGRGTRLFDGKYYFTIYDFVGASQNFQDAEWDGDPQCPVCGNYPCSCRKKPSYPDIAGEEEPSSSAGEPTPKVPTPCPVCGHLPCTCSGGQTRTVVVKLSEEHKLELFTEWEERFQFGDELITLEEFVRRLFGRMPKFFKGQDDLVQKWQHPDTRSALLMLLEQEGFAEEKLEMLKKVLNMEKCDLLDVLQFIAYNTTPMEREKRVQLVKEQYLKQFSNQQQQFDNLILEYYVRNGFKELDMENLKTFIKIKYNSLADAKDRLGWQAQEISRHYLDLQSQLYGVQDKNEIHMHIHAKNATIDKFFNNVDNYNVE